MRFFLYLFSQTVDNDRKLSEVHKETMTKETNQNILGLSFVGVVAVVAIFGIVYMAGGSSQSAVAPQMQSPAPVEYSEATGENLAGEAMSYSECVQSESRLCMEIYDSRSDRERCMRGVFGTCSTWEAMKYMK